MTQIWDTAGQEKYRAICQNQYKDALGAMIVFDLTRKNTFDSCVSWIEEFKLNAPEMAQIMLVGNKKDIVEMSPELREVSEKDGKKFCELQQLLYKETSAVSNKNVDDAFVDLLQEIYYTVNARNPLEAGPVMRRGFTLNNSVVEEGGLKSEAKKGCC